MDENFFPCIKSKKQLKYLQISQHAGTLVDLKLSNENVKEV